MRTIKTTMRAAFGGLAAAMALSGALCAFPAKAHAPGTPFLRLESLLSEPSASLVGLEVRTVSGDVLYTRNAQRLFAPASVLKLATSYAALQRLGGDTRLRTELLASGPVVDGELHGDLWFKGHGDPSLRASDLAKFAAALQVKGIRRIRGDVVADATLFEGPRYPAGWMWDDLAHGFAAPVSALSLDGNTSGDRAMRDAPEQWAAERLSDRLREAGIVLAGSIRVGRAPREAQVLHTHWSAPLSEIVRTLNKDSNNFYAEILVRHLGLQQASGSHAAGLRVVTDTLGPIGWATGSFRIEDGSGLSRYNAVTPAQMADLLVAAYRMPEAEAFRASLPIAGKDGTLAHRMRGTRAEGVFMAKTGTMSGVSSLCGYLALPDREPLVVALMVTGFVGSAKPVQGLQDAVIGALVEAVE